MTFTFSALFPDATDDEKLQQIRNWRNAELAATDWTQLADSQADKTAWATYRQALRDLPAQNKDPKKIKFPTRPE
jgi:TorA maturation chaperone TorD